MSAPLRALLEHLVDYAGLFPPASLDMRDAVARYAAYQAGPHAWMLGRFVAPVDRLGEFAREVDDVLARVATPWRVSAVIGADMPGGLGAIAAFNASHRQAMCDAIEVKAASRDDIVKIARAVRSEGVAAFVEVPLVPNPVPLIEEIGAQGLCAKMRTGGTTVDAFPVVNDVVQFIRSSVRAGVPFKATAGLHHALCGDYRLTYAPDSPCGAMFGFLNVFLATALVRDGGTDREIEEMLLERDRATISVSAEGIRWRERVFLTGRLLQLRTRVAISFGSCSFDEPVSDLTAMQLS